MTPAAVPLLALALAAPAPPATAARVERRLLAMGTELDVVVEAAQRPAALRASERVVRELAAVEERLSTWRPDSELSRLNAAPLGRPVPLSPATLDELTAAAACRRATGGAFDPAVGALVAAWGLRAGGRVPEGSEIRAALAAGGMDGVELDAGAGTAVRRRPGVRLEEGGFGKGAGLAAAAAALAAEPAVRRAMVDLGGQLALVGRGPFRVQVADPRQRERALVTLTLDGGSLATSGNSQRGIEVDGRRYGHLLDPATGRPVRDFGSVTVWTADPLRADCLSTALYVMGPEAGLAWAVATDGVEALVVETTADGPRVRATEGLARRAAPAVEIYTQSRPGTRPDDEERTAVALPWEGRTAVLTDPAPPSGDVGIHEEYR